MAMVGDGASATAEEGDEPVEEIRGDGRGEEFVDEDVVVYGLERFVQVSGHKRGAKRRLPLVEAIGNSGDSGKEGGDGGVKGGETMLGGGARERVRKEGED